MTIYSNAPNDWVANDIPFPQATANQELKEKFDEIDSAFGLSALRADNLNLQIAMGGTPDEQVDVDAECLTLFNATFESNSIVNINLTIDNTAGGANGIDTGGVAINTLYYIWVIAKVDGTVAGLFSVSNTIGTVTLPGGYLYARIIGAIFTDGASDFIPGKWINDMFWYDSAIEIYDANGSLTWIDIDISTEIPHLISRNASIGGRIDTSQQSVDIRGKGFTQYFGSTRGGEQPSSVLGFIIPTDSDGLIQHQASSNSKNYHLFVNGYVNIINSTPA